MKYTHLIISRVALKWYDKDGEKLRCESELNMSWEEWLNDSIRLYNKYTRESLRRQTNQNFILISVIDESVKDIGELLPNEHILRIKSINNLSKDLESFIYERFKSPLYLMSRIDRDDCFGLNYVNELQLNANKYLSVNSKPESVFFDITDLNMYDPVNDIFLTKPYPTNATSPFTSILVNYPTPILYQGHGRIKGKMKGFKIKSLDILQIIHGKNLANQLRGIPIKTNVFKRLLDFGILKNLSFKIDEDLYNWIKKNIPIGSTILELGSGYGTLELSKDYNMISIESDLKWIGLSDSHYIHAPIINKWYDLDILRRELSILKYDVILVDGPWIGVGNRYGFIDNIKLFKSDSIIIFDDTNREDEKFMCEYFSNETNRQYTEYIGDTKNFSVIK